MMGPLAIEMDTIVTTNTADVWEQLPVERRIELMAWVRATNTMKAWEAYQMEKNR